MNTMNLKKKNNSVNKMDIRIIAAIGIMAAIICVATMVITVPSITPSGYVHIGDGMVFIAAIIFGKKKGAMASALGMGMADLLLGWTIYVPFTIVIKGIMACIAGSIAYMGDKKGENVVQNSIAFFIAGLWMIIGYFASEIIIFKYILKSVETIPQAGALALANMFPNFVQFLIGMLIAVPVVKMLRGRLKFH